MQVVLVLEAVILVAFVLVLVGLANRRTDPEAQALARSILAMRAAQEIRTTYRPASVSDRTAAQETYDRAALDLENAGCSMLGDYEEVAADERVTGWARWFTADEGRVVGWVTLRSPEAGATPLPIAAFFSELPPVGFVVTRIGMPPVSLAEPESVHTSDLPWAAGLSEALARHRANVTLASGDGCRATPSASATFDDAVALQRRLREHRTQWRRAREGDLLRLDVESVLGDRFAALGADVTRLVEAEL